MCSPGRYSSSYFDKICSSRRCSGTSCSPSASSALRSSFRSLIATSITSSAPSTESWRVVSVSDANFEQAAIHLYAQRRAVDFARHATLVPYERLNSPTAAYKPGDFVCHHAGRRGAAAKYLAMVDAFRMGDINESKCCAQPCARTPG